MQKKISLEEFTKELKIAIEDIFIATVFQTENILCVKFPNGQEFTILPEEV